MIDEGLHVAHRRADARAESSFARRAALAARIPREDGEIRQVDLVGKMSHAAGMLVAAMEHNDRAARHTSHRWPMAVEEIDAIVGPERLLFYWPHGNFEPARFASPMPARTRFTTVRTSNAASIGTAQPSHACDGPNPIHNASAP